MADNVAQSIKDLQKDLAALDKQLLSNNANWDKLGQTIVDSMKRGGLGLDDLFSKMKGQKDVLKLRAIIDRDALMDDVKKLQTAVDKGVKSVKIGGVEITGQRQIEQALEGYKAQLKLVPKTLAEAYDYAVKIANTLGGGNSSKASKEWLERTALNTKEKKALDDATNGYIKQTQAIQDLNRTLDELKQKRATAEALPVTGVGKSGISYKTDASKQSALGNIDKEITNVETKINNATNAAQKFQAQLIAMQGEKKTKAMSRALGVEEAEAEVQKIPTAFDRVIAQINQRAAQSKDKFAKQLVNAEGLRNEAKNAAAEVSHELDYIWRGSQSHMLAAWRNNTGYLTDFGRQDAVNQIRLSQEYKSNLDALKTQEVRDKLTQALTRYKDALQAVITLEEQQRRSAAQYSAQERAVEGVTRRFNENEQAIARVRDRWDELNVKRQAGLVNEKDFKANSQKLLDEYDRLIAKRKEFETADIGQSLSERLRKQQEEEKRLEADRVRSAKETSKIITEERGKQALSSLIGSPKMNAAVQQQLKYMQQIRSIGKDINALQSNKNRSAEENALLEKRKNELRDVLELQKRLNNEQKGSANLARQIDKYNQLRGKVGETTEEVKKQKVSLESMLPTLRRIASAFGVAFSVQGLVNFGKKLVETRGEFELQQVALRSILQNKQLADEIWDKTMQAALQSPFTAMQLTKYTKQLAAYRIETDKLFDTTKRLADVSAGLGVDMQRLILAYGQVKAANYLRASEIRQFTEAGVNVLGELSNYFSETRGQMISTAQVMDMVQKRMVKFEDVEEIFKRLTDEGGIFYNMQYVQSQTVWGQLRKLRDAYDQMQNSIGKANEGVIKDFVSILNSAVQNWRGIAVTLKSIGWGVAIGWMSKYALALSGITAASMKTKRSIVSLCQGIEGFGKALKANLPMLAIGAAVALITRFVESARQMKQVNDEIDEQITTLYGASQQMSDYQSTIEKNNELIKSNGKEITDNKKRQEALNEALNSNSGIYAKLKNEYPQIAEQLKQNANGTIENTDALKSYNEQLEREMTLLAMREQKANIGNLWGAFSDSATDDLQDVLKNTTKVQTQIRNLQLRLKTDVAKMKASGNVDERQIALANEFLAIPTEGDMEEALKRANEIRQKYLKEYAQYVKGDIGRGGYKNLGELSVFGNDFDIQGLGHTLEEFRREMVNIGWIGDGDNLGKLETDFVGIIENFAGFAKSISDEYSGDVLDFVANNSEIIKKAVEGDAENGIEASPEIVKGIGDALIKAGFATTKEMQSVWNNLLNDRIIFTKKNEELNAIDAQIAAEEAKKIKNRNQQLLDDLRRQREDYIKSHGLDWFAGSSTTGGTNNQSPFDDNNKGKKSASKLISLIREMRAEYDKLSKSAYGYAKSEATVRESYKQSVKEILGKAGITDYDFTTNAGMIAALEKVKIYANKLGPEAAAEVEKYIGQLKTEMTINAQVRIREDFGRQMEEAFGNYELTLELQKLNIPQDAVKDLFPDFDYTSIGQLQDVMNKFFEDRQKVDEKGNVLFSKDDLEAYRKWSVKIDAEILKMRKEKAQQYSKYLEKEYSERAKVEMQYAKDVAFVTANMSDETQRKNILSNLQKKYQDDINELNWKSFKESDFYVEMMEDITSLPKEYTQMMLDKINEILQHPETLSPRALKEAINARQKVLEAQMNLEPLDVMRTSVAQIRTAMNDVGGTSWKDTKEKIHEQINATQEQIDELEEEARCWDDTAAKMQVYEDAAEAVSVARGKLGGSTTKELEKEGATLQSVLDKYKNLRKGYEEEQQQLLIDFKRGDLTDEEQQTRQQLLDKGYLDESGELTSAGNDRLNYLIRQNSYYQEQIDLLNELITKEKELQSIREGQSGTDAEMQRGEGGVGTAANARARAQEARDEAAQPKKRIQNLKDYLKAFKNFDDSFAKFNAAINSTLNAVNGMGNAFYDMFDALGGETDALTDGWKEFGNTMITQITQTLTMIPMMVAAFAAAGIAINSALGIIGLIAEALQLLFVAIGAIAKLHDAGYEKEIENQQKKIDALRDAYARLEKQIEKTWSSVSYMKTYEQQVQNIHEQIDATEAQLAAARQEKGANTTEGREKIRGYEKALVDLYDQLEDNEQKMREVFGGIGKEGYRSAAEGFVDAWKSAFLETGDGLQGLQDHFDEFLQDWFVKQATMQGVAKYYEKVFDYINDIVKDGSVPTYQKIENARALADDAASKSDELMRIMAGIFGIGDSGSLSGLAAGIQGMTEEQANILEAYWNSVRMYNASMDMNIARIVAILENGNFMSDRRTLEDGMVVIPKGSQAIDTSSVTPYLSQIVVALTSSSVETNPMLRQMSIIAANTQATHQLLQSVTRSGHSLGGYGIKVFND